MTRRSLFGRLLGALAVGRVAPAVARLARPPVVHTPLELTLEEFAKRYLNPWAESHAEVWAAEIKSRSHSIAYLTEDDWNPPIRIGNPINLPTPASLERTLTLVNTGL